MNHGRLDPVQHLPPRRSQGLLSKPVWRLALPILLVAGFFVLAAADLPARRWRVDLEPKEFFGRQLLVAVLFVLMNSTQPIPVACMLLLILLLDRRGRAIAIHCLWAVLLADMVHGGLKLTVGRHRPMAFMPSAATVADAKPDYQKRWSETWIGPRLRGRAFKNSSFPSGHATAAFAYWSVLAWFYPRWRWGCYFVAAGCGVSRFFWEAHWWTDIYAGALIGLAGAYLSLRPWLYVDPIMRVIGRIKK